MYSVPWEEMETVKGVPAGKRFVVRLMAELSSLKTHEGDTVQAHQLRPRCNGAILIPAGSTFSGKVVQANSTGWGFKHETASLTIHWTKAALVDGRELAIDMRVFQVENAQESVTGKGKIQGIRSTGTPGYSAENGVLTFAGIDPVAYIFASASGNAVLGFAEPEILYHAGTELILENVTPLLTAQTYPPSVQPVAETSEAHAELQTFVKRLPYRTKTQGSGKDSDVTNLVFVGSASGLQRAFEAAGWLPAEELNAGSTFRTIKTLSGNRLTPRRRCRFFCWTRRSRYSRWAKRRIPFRRGITCYISHCKNPRGTYRAHGFAHAGYRHCLFQEAEDLHPCDRRAHRQRTLEDRE